MEHNTETGLVTYFDKDGNTLGQKQLKKGERAWGVIDPKAEKYYTTSPYAYCINNPINATDPDGRLVIFVNGMHAGSGGKSEYWSGFDTKVMSHLNDNNSRYYDGSIAGIGGVYGRSTLGFSASNLDPDTRYSAGYSAGKRDASSILGQLSKGEKIKIITHSMGAVYAKGLIQALIDQGVDPSLFAFEADFAPFQPTKQKAVQGVNTFQYTNYNDNVANNRILGSPFGKIDGTSVYNINYD